MLCVLQDLKRLHPVLRLLWYTGTTRHGITGGKDPFNSPCYVLVSYSDLASRSDL